MQASHHQIDAPEAGEGRRRRLGERGASLVEYALLLALVAVVAVGAVAFLGGRGSSSVKKGADGISPPTTAAPGCANAAHPRGYATGTGYWAPCYDPDTQSGYFI